MKPFEYSYPTRIHFGEGVVEEALKGEIARMGGAVLLAFGGGSIIIERDCATESTLCWKMPAKP